MQMTIDAVFLDGEGLVLDMAPQLAPVARGLLPPAGRRHTLELAAGGAGAADDQNRR